LPAISSICSIILSFKVSLGAPGAIPIRLTRTTQTRLIKLIIANHPRKKVTRDPKAPKQPSNAVFQFPLEEIRSSVVAENPEMNPLDVPAEVGKRWRELIEKQKQP